MGWGSGYNNEGRLVGYMVLAQCDLPDCHETIDRGLAFMCGEIHTAVTFGHDGPGCGLYFCEKHRWPTDHGCEHPHEYAVELEEEARER